MNLQNTEISSRRLELPETLSIEVTTRCNCECCHCFARARSSPPSQLPFEVVKDIIAEGYLIGYRHLHITGGEPLLWPDLFKALDFAFKLQFKTVFLNTNGTLLTNDICKTLSKYDNLAISLSLEGSPDIHNYFRGDGSYASATNGLKTSLNNNLNLFIFTTLCKSLLPHLPRFVFNLYRTFPGIRDLTLIRLFLPSNLSSHLSCQLLSPSDFLHFVQTASFLNIIGFRTAVLDDPLVTVVSKVLGVPCIPRSLPPERSGRLVVLANGDISCHHSSGTVFGKYSFGMLSEVLLSDRYRQRFKPDTIKCPSCKYVFLCRSNNIQHPSFSSVKGDDYSLFCRSVLDLLFSTNTRSIPFFCRSRIFFTTEQLTMLDSRQ